MDKGVVFSDVTWRCHPTPQRLALEAGLQWISPPVGVRRITWPMGSRCLSRSACDSCSKISANAGI